MLVKIIATGVFTLVKARLNEFNVSIADEIERDQLSDNYIKIWNSTLH